MKKTSARNIKINYYFCFFKVDDGNHLKNKKFLKGNFIC